MTNEVGGTNNEQSPDFCISPVHTLQ
jgi:hypothetical protein